MTELVHEIAFCMFCFCSAMLTFHTEIFAGRASAKTELWSKSPALHQSLTCLRLGGCHCLFLLESGGFFLFLFLVFFENVMYILS